MAKRVVILGSTGSIGLSALDVIRQSNGEFDLVGLAAGSNVDAVARQLDEFRPELVALSDPAAAKTLQARGADASVLSGPEGVEEVAALDVDIVLCAIVGAAGLKPVLAAVKAGNNVALANKEPMVMAGPLIMKSAAEMDVNVLPVDSEHNAIFQCLLGHGIGDVQCVHLTASGGPFYGRPRSELRNVTPEQAANHPTWDMGAKISIDSATLMNKGLEVMEAMWLFDLPLSKIDVIIHPQSVVHSLVEFTDGSILAHLGVTDMKFPIQFALKWPERAQTPMKRLDLTTVGPLTFAAPDFSEFPCLRLALDAAKRGGTAPAILNAANEVAVKAFQDRQIGFLQISDVIEEVMNTVSPAFSLDLHAILESDAAGRRKAHELAAAGAAYA